MSDIMNAQEITGKYDSQSLAESAAAEEIKVEVPSTGDISGESKEEAPKVEDAFSKKFAALSRKEKQIRIAEQQQRAKMQKMESDYNAKMAALEERLKKLDAPAPKVEQLPLEQRLKQNPLEALKELGLGYDKLTQLAINDGRLTPEMQMELWKQELESKQRSELDTIRKELADREQREAQQREQQVLNQFKDNIKSFISEHPEYEMIQATNQPDLVFSLIDEHFQKSGKVLSIKEAADHIESHLESEARKLLSLKKLAAQKAAAPLSQPKVKVSTPTLSNSQAQSLSGSQKRFLSQEESLAEAAKLLRWDD